MNDEITVYICGEHAAMCIFYNRNETREVKEEIDIVTVVGKLLDTTPELTEEMEYACSEATYSLITKLPTYHKYFKDGNEHNALFLTAVLI